MADRIMEVVRDEADRFRWAMSQGTQMFFQTKMARASARRRNGFSLVELIIVMALIVVMFVMLHSSGSRSYQIQLKEQCRKNLVAQFTALSTYATDHDGAFPVVTNDVAGPDAALGLLVPTCTTDTKMFICPGSKDGALPAAKPFIGRPISYAVYSGRTDTGEAGIPLVTDRQVNDLAKLAGDPLFSVSGKGPGNNHDRFGGNILWLDGRVSYSGTNALEALPLGPVVRLVNPSHPR
jgi:prepilin-type N-terminal cleavage/methylation domain-containing protein/prepilin-type processing-associated H-X9-DG protein